MSCIPSRHHRRVAVLCTRVYDVRTGTRCRLRHSCIYTTDCMIPIYSVMLCSLYAFRENRKLRVRERVGRLMDGLMGGSVSGWVGEGVSEKVDGWPLTAVHGSPPASFPYGTGYATPRWLVGFVTNYNAG